MASFSTLASVIFLLSYPKLNVGMLSETNQELSLHSNISCDYESCINDCLTMFFALNAVNIGQNTHLEHHSFYAMSYVLYSNDIAN